MLYLAGVLVVVVGIGVSIALHELGHLLPAKRFGVKVTQYMIGFGPTIWSRRRGETEYGIKAVPLGGYVRMIGMYPPRPSDPEGQLRPASTGRLGAMIEQARAESLEELQPGDEDRVFYKLSAGKKVVVMLGGPVMNLLIAFVLLGGILTLHGLPTAVPAVSQVAACLPSAAPTAQQPQPPCAPGDPASPAAAAGLQVGDEIVAVDGSEVTTWSELTPIIKGSAGQALTVTVQRGDDRFDLVVPIASLSRAQVDANGAPVLDSSGAVVTETVGYLGMAPSLVNVPQPLSAVPGYLWDATAQTAGVVLRIPEKMVGIAQAAFGSQERDENGPISVVGVGRIGGEIASADVAANVADPNLQKVVVLLWLVVSLNIALFVFNLIPLLPLDGGHVVGALWEGLRRTAARMTGRADPGHVDVAKGLPVAYGATVVLLAMSVLLIYADIVKPVRL